MEYKVPRSFKLLAELEAAEKGRYPASMASVVPFISLGLVDGADMSLTKWHASIIPEQGSAIGDRFYQLEIEADANYPDHPPIIKFVNRVALGSIVDGAGRVRSFSFMRWTRESSIFEALVALRSLLNRHHRESSKVSGTY